MGGGVSGLHALFLKESRMGDENESSQDSNEVKGDWDGIEFGTLQLDTATFGTLDVVTPSDGYDELERR